VDDLNGESAALYGYECFTHGFRLAVSLLFESLNGMERFARNDENKKDRCDGSF